MKTQRRKNGSTIAETGPMLWFFLLLIFFPLLNLLALVANYCLAFLLHNNELREIALRPPNQGAARAAIQRVDQEFLSTTLAAFLKLQPADISHEPVRYETTGPQSMKVTLTTTVVVEPFLYIPLPFQVPALNQPVSLRFTTTRPQEELARDPGL